MKRGMDAVIEKSNEAMRGKRLPMMKRKPGVAVMIAVGKPKMAPPREAMKNDEAEASDDDTCPECGYKHSKSEKRGDGLTKSQKIAALEEKIAYLKAELALLEDEDEEEDEDEMDEEEDEDEEY